MIGLKIDAKAFDKALAKFLHAIDPAAHAGTFAVASEVMRLSQLEVPHDVGTLQNSGTVEPQPNGDVVVGYHTEYAARLHEHPEYRFQKGRKGKYLEDPIRRNEKTLGVKFVKAVEKELPHRV